MIGHIYIAPDESEAFSKLQNGEVMPQPQSTRQDTEGLFKCNCPHETRAGCSEPDCPHYVARTAPPKPAPDAMRPDISRFMETVRRRWNFEETEFDAIENVISDSECVAALFRPPLPSPDGAGEAVAWRWRERFALDWKYSTYCPTNSLLEREPLYATPPVRAGRETIARIIHSGAFDKDSGSEHQQREALLKADAILALSRQPPQSGKESASG